MTQVGPAAPSGRANDTTPCLAVDHRVPLHLSCTAMKSLQRRGARRAAAHRRLRRARAPGARPPRQRRGPADGQLVLRSGQARASAVNWIWHFFDLGSARGQLGGPLDLGSARAWRRWESRRATAEIKL
jgi:hypothetical protein